jgi:predicted TIM-barrel fold metal-dependent hydrolase
MMLIRWASLLATILSLETAASSLGARGSKPDDSLVYIALEEHWYSPSLSDPSLAPLSATLSRQGGRLPDIITEIGPIRLANMTAHRVRKQIISHASSPAGLERPDLARAANDELAKAIAGNTERFAGFAFLPMAYPELAAAELERCVKKLGFVGALFDNHLANGTYFDGEPYRPFWAKAAALGVPIYLHPTWPGEATFTKAGGSYAPSAPGSFPMAGALIMGGSGWGWHQDAGLHFLRLYAAGIFDEFPTLKVILGHNGEMVPFMLDRTNVLLGTHNTRAKTSLVQTYKRNIWLTTSGMFSLDPLATILRNTAIDRILYSIDYPFSNSKAGDDFMKKLKSSGLVTRTEWEMIAYGNAQKLLNVK